MKRFIAVLSGLLVLPAFAEVAPVYYDEIVEYTDDMIDAIEEESAEETPVQTQQNVAQRTTINRSTSRAMSAANTNNQRTNTSTRAMASSQRNAQKLSRGTVSRNTKNAVSNSPKVVSRSTTTTRNTQSKKPTTARISVNNSVVSGYRTNSSTTPVTVLEDSGAAIYNPNSAAGGTGTETARIGVGSRRATARISTPAITTPIVTEEDVSSTTSNLAAIAELTDYCKAQYATCMDNYCNVLDDNQGRCSCSKNLKNYEKTEQALAQATEDFKDVVQKIKYIGLTSDQVSSLFTETEAELTMKSKTDSSQIKNSLDAIKRQIIDVSPSSTSVNTSNVTMDLSGLLNADFTSGFDLSSFLGTWATTNGATNNVSNQRGETLYRTATQRCKTAVLNSCAAQGIDTNIVTNSYDLEIDKQCIFYERNLNEANAEMKSNVTNASTILQQARLLLMQNKNSYDLRSCVAAIDSCMQDEYVCGSDYELCLDPTGKYLAGGEIVKGGTPGVSGGSVGNTKDICDIDETPNSSCESVNDWTSKGMYELYATWNYNTETVTSSALPGGNDTLNAWGGGRNENLGNYIDVALTEWAQNYTKSVASDDMATYILQKVGYMDKNDKVHGMCASVMKQCQDYAYSSQRSNKKYLPANEVIRQYLASALTKIKLQQDSVVADYAEGCRSDVSSCLSTNGFDETNTATTASTTAVNACRSEIATCMSVGGYKPSDSSRLTLRAMRDWVDSMLRTCPANYYLTDDGQSSSVSCEPCRMAAVVNSSGGTTAQNIQLESDGGQETLCHCPDGYTDYEVDSETGMPVKCKAN